MTKNTASELLTCNVKYQESEEFINAVNLNKKVSKSKRT